MYLVQDDHGRWWLEVQTKWGLLVIIFITTHPTPPRKGLLDQPSMQ